MTDQRPLLAGVIGFPITQSRSPRLFAHWFSRHAIPGYYVPLAAEPAAFEAVLSTLPQAGFRGLNVTAPHKTEALRLAETRSATAEAIGAANTLVFSPDGGIHADNTDAYGFVENLRAGAPQWRPEAGPAVVLGAGGAARAIVHALDEAGVPEIRLLNRTQDRAQALRDTLNAPITVASWTDREAALDGAALLVNTTVLGMTGKAPLELRLDALPTTAVVNDIVYAPLETQLLADARSHGAHCVDGLGMLLHQARPGFRLWFGTDPVVDAELRAAALA